MAFDFRECEIENEVIHLLLDELVLDLDLQESFFVGMQDTDIVIFEETFSGLFGELHNRLASEGSSLFFVAMDVELLHGRGRNVLTFSFGTVLEQDV